MALPSIETVAPEMASLPAHVRLQAMRRAWPRFEYARYVIVAAAAGLFLINVALLIITLRPLGAIPPQKMDTTPLLVAAQAILWLALLVLIDLALRWIPRWSIIKWRRQLRATYPNGLISPCPRCQYDVHACTSDECPECGEVIYRITWQSEQ